MMNIESLTKTSRLKQTKKNDEKEKKNTSDNDRFNDFDETKR